MPRAGWQWKSFVPLWSGTKIETNSRLHAPKKKDIAKITSSQSTT